MSENIKAGKESLEQQQLAQAMLELGKQTQRPESLGGTADLERFNREIITLKQATERTLEELNRFKASAEEQLQSLQTEMRELKDKLEQKDEQEEAAGEQPELQLVDDLQDLTVHKRPLFQRFRGFFRSKSLKKKKKKKKNKKKKGLYEQSDPSRNEETRTGIVGRHNEITESQISFEETRTGIFGRHNEIRGSQISFAESKSIGSCFRREDSNMSSRVRFGHFAIALPQRKTYSSPNVAIHYAFNEEEPEVFEESREPIKIAKQPKSQTAKEGSEVKFECRGQGKSTELSYQWFKDGETLQDEKASILVLNPVQLRDFGYYVCCVNYLDFYGEGWKSSRAKLDVTPDSQSGMRLKRLAELDPNTKERVFVLLQNKKYGLGGWREVAPRFELESYKIDDLGNSKEPGKCLMEFLAGSRPNLTVYEFCKVLKENPIKRLDIVDILEDHFFV